MIGLGRDQSDLLRLETAGSSLGLVLGLVGEGVAPIETREIYAALDGLGARQECIEKRLAKKPPHDGTLVLYDVSSSYLEGRRCALARFGYSRDKRADRPQDRPKSHLGPALRPPRLSPGPDLF